MARKAIQAAALLSRIEVGSDGKARRLVRRADVLELLRQQQAAEEQKGKGPPMKVPRNQP
jgi:hypothetical protein